MMFAFTLGDKKPAQNTAAIHREPLILRKKEIILTTMKYGKEGLRVFVPCQYDEKKNRKY